jgi:hypothetical protein
LSSTRPERLEDKPPHLNRMIPAERIAANACHLLAGDNSGPIRSGDQVTMIDRRPARLINPFEDSRLEFVSGARREEFDASRAVAKHNPRTSSIGGRFSLQRDQAPLGQFPQLIRGEWSAHLVVEADEGDKRDGHGGVNVGMADWTA